MRASKVQRGLASFIRNLLFGVQYVKAFLNALINSLIKGGPKKDAVEIFDEYDLPFIGGYFSCASYSSADT